MMPGNFLDKDEEEDEKERRNLKIERKKKEKVSIFFSLYYTCKRNALVPEATNLMAKMKTSGIALQFSNDILDPLKTEGFKPMRPLKEPDISEYKMLILKEKDCIRMLRNSVNNQTLLSHNSINCFKFFNI